MKNYLTNTIIAAAHYHPTYINGQIIHTENREALSDILDQMS